MQERDPMNLSSLPRLRAPDGLWPSIEVRLRSGSRKPPAFAYAAAAAVFLALILAWWSPWSPDDAARSHGLAPYWHASARLEAEFERLETAVLDVSAAQQAAILENRLAWIDHFLAQAPDDIGLWRQRLIVLDELNDVYANQAWLAQPDTTLL